MDGDYVQYGCGLSCPDGWLNFDASPRVRIEKSFVLGSLFRVSGKVLFPPSVRYGDIVRGLPVPERSAKAVYCSHVLEHIDRYSVATALKNTLEMLVPGGVFRLVVPDLLWRAESFVKQGRNGSCGAADDFMRRSHLGREAPSTGIIRRAHLLFGNSDHRWMYDEATMRALLTDAGFESIRRCEFGDSEDPMFALVENKARFIDEGNKELALEAKRPMWSPERDIGQ